MSRPADHRAAARVRLPSGKEIEVLCLLAEGGPALGGARPLHVCPACASQLVAPVWWDEAGPVHWRVALRCPNCGWRGEGVYAEELVERFDEELDRGTESLVRDLQRLMRANMEDQVDRFAAALAADQVWPMDF